MSKPNRKREKARGEAKPKQASQPAKRKWLGAPLIRKDVLARYGRRVATIIADSEKGDDITASVTHCNVSSDELYWLVEDGILSGGFEAGERDCSRIFCRI